MPTEEADFLIVGVRATGRLPHYFGWGTMSRMT
jgi:hypothetical protein